VRDSISRRCWQLPIFIVAPNAAFPDITDANIADLLSLVSPSRFVRLVAQIEAHAPKFPDAHSAIWNRENLHKLMANLHDAIHPGRNQIHIMNLTRQARELVVDLGTEVHQTSHTLGGGHGPTHPPGRDETETMVKADPNEIFRDRTATIQA
jgi:hypothetical protein